MNCYKTLHLQLRSVVEQKFKWFEWGEKYTGISESITYSQAADHDKLGRGNVPFIRKTDSELGSLHEAPEELRTITI